MHFIYQINRLTTTKSRFNLFGLISQHPGWNEFVKPFQSEALDWHSVWINSGRPQSGFVYDMRRSTRKTYHEKVDSVLKREKQIKGIRIAESYLNSNSRDFWKEAELLRGRKRGPSAAVEGLTNGDDIANAFSRYYDDLYNSVDFDHSRCVSYILM